MAIITFWSNSKKESGKTSSMAAIATQMAVEHNYKILIVSTIYNDTAIEDCYWTEKDETFVNSLTAGKHDIVSSTDGIVKLSMSNKLTPQNIVNYTRLVFPENRLEVITGAKSEDYQRIARENNVFKDIVQNANEFYDYVFVDLDKGLERSHVREILEISDLVVVNLFQSKKILKDYQDLRKENKLFQRDNVLVLIGRYDKFSKYNAKNIAWALSSKGRTCTIPYNTLYLEACSEGKVADYFLRYRKLKPDDRNALFVSEVEYAGNTFIEKIKELRRYR